MYKERETEAINILNSSFKFDVLLLKKKRKSLTCIVTPFVFKVTIFVFV